jgi:hypothetical protein
MPEPLPLASLRELRWWVARGVAPLTALRAAGVALRVLQALAGQQPAVDGHTGEALFPLPLAHRQMASPACLPHIAQVGAACARMLSSTHGGNGAICRQGSFGPSGQHGEARGNVAGCRSCAIREPCCTVAS